MIMMVFVMSFGTSRAQNALHFDGSNDYVICGTDTSLSNFRKNITIEAWVYADNWKTNVYEGCVVVKEDNSSNYGYMLRAGNGGRLNFAIGQGAWRELTTSSSVMKTNEWYHLAATYDGIYMRLYVDGKQVDSMYETDQIGISTSTPLTIGSHSSPTSYSRHWEGKIDEVRIWKTTRTAAQISQNMDKEFCTGEPNLVAYYKFNEGTANGSNTNVTVAKDFSGKKNDGKLLNFDLIKSGSNWTQGMNLKTTTSYDTISVSRCNRYQLPGSQKYVYASGQYQATIDNYMGCDSLLTINLMIQSNSKTELDYLVCDSMKSPNFDKYYTQSGVYDEILVNQFGCDSIVRLNVTVTKPVISEKSYRSCNSVVLDRIPQTVVYESGSLSDTFMGWGGCDSIVIHRFEVLRPSRDTQTLFLCNFIRSPSDNNIIFKKTGWYYDTIDNFNGCDSVLVYHVVSARTEGSINVKACNSYTAPSKSRTWTESGQYRDTLIGANYLACDSFINIDLLINKPKVEMVNVGACGFYETPQGQRTTQSGKLYESVPSYLGCDSIQYIYNVSITQINAGVKRDWNRLIADELPQTGTTFQWLDCSNDLEPITGANLSEFEMLKSGEYALEIRKGECIDTSRCKVYAFTNSANIQSTNIRIYPNPTNGLLSLKLNNIYVDVSMSIYNNLGQIVEVHKLGMGSTFSFRTNLSNGIYLIKVFTQEKELSRSTLIKN